MFDRKKLKNGVSEMRTRGKQVAAMCGEAFSGLLSNAVGELKTSGALQKAEKKLKRYQLELSRAQDVYYRNYNTYFGSYTHLRGCRERVDNARQEVVALKQSIMSKVSGLTVDGFDFATVPDAFIALDLSFNNITFRNATNLDERIACDQCLFDGCTFLPDTIDKYSRLTGFYGEPFDKLKNCVLFAEENVVTKWMNLAEGNELGTVVIDRQKRKPLIAVVYVPGDGIFYASEMLNILGSKDINILKLDSNSLPEGNLSDLKHPIAAYLKYVDGIYLPGGPDVETNVAEYSPREKLERYLVKQSLLLKIPLLAVCRGHQFVGHYFGADVAHVDDWHHESDVKIVDESTRLYQMAKKLEQEGSVSLRSSSEYDSDSDDSSECEGRVTLTKEADGYHYRGYCAHSQGVFFRDNKVHSRVKIAARTSSDNLPECMEIGGHIITFQHHHAATHKRDLFSKSAITMYADMVKKYHQFKESRVMTRIRTGSITATSVFTGAKRPSPSNDEQGDQLEQATRKVRRRR